MKALTTLLFLLLSISSLANEIDKLQTAADVNQFLAEKIGKRYEQYPLLELLDSTKIKNQRFFKTDIDNNGLTDLLIDGRYILIIIDRGNNKYDTHFYEGGLNHVSLVATDIINEPKKIMLHQARMPKNKIDTLIYKFGGFVEYKPEQAPKSFTLDTLRLRTNYCYGECPVFSLVIYKNRTVRYHATEFNKQQGEFQGMIPEKEFDELIALLKYIHVPELNDKYTAPWTDDQPFYADIIYNDKKKYINDYGGIGTFGLRLLYRKIFEWQDSIEWKK